MTKKFKIIKTPLKPQIRKAKKPIKIIIDPSCEELEIDPELMSVLKYEIGEKDDK